jgi:hypothetical protein
MIPYWTVETLRDRERDLRHRAERRRTERAPSPEDRPVAFDVAPVEVARSVPCEDAVEALSHAG